MASGLGRVHGVWVAVGSIVVLASALALLALAPPPSADGAAVAKQGKGKEKRYKGPKIPTPDASRCDFLDPSVCLQPFPNNLYLDSDADTATGNRLDLSPQSMPVNTAGTAIDPTEINRNDGFSPGPGDHRPHRRPREPGGLRPQRHRPDRRARRVQGQEAAGDRDQRQDEEAAPRVRRDR